MLQSQAGWPSPEYHLMSWALSCLRLTSYYDNVTLYTDTVGAFTLIDELQLPYTTVNCELDILNRFDERLWVAAKLYTYSKQEAPFLHIDGDVFIWKAFNETLLSSGLIAQNLEIMEGYYEKIMELLGPQLKYLPQEMNISSQKRDFAAYNAGILGGSDIDFFKEYCGKAFDFALKNVNHINPAHLGDFNVLFEQYFFYCLSKQRKKKVELLLPGSFNEYVGLANFHEVPYDTQYLHLLSNFKLSKCQQLADKLRLDYPEYYYRIIALFKNKKLPLKKATYYTIDGSTEVELLETYNQLKENFRNNNLALVASDGVLRKFIPSNSRIELIKNLAATLKSGLDNPTQTFKAQIDDIKKFELKIDQILNEKFATYSWEYLYARDMVSPAYCSIIFGDKLTGGSVLMIADPIYELIESRYNWSEVDNTDYGKREAIGQLEAESSCHKTLVVPEWDAVGYSLLNIDDLDLSILEICKKAVTRSEIMETLESYFDPSDLQENRSEFEELIDERIKIALNRKIIKIFQPN